MIIRIEGLDLVYPGGVHALDAVSLGDRLRDLSGLLGPNGAGKTSLIKILATLLKPDRRFGPGGRPGPRQAAEGDPPPDRLSAPDFTSFPKLTAREFLDYEARLKRDSAPAKPAPPRSTPSSRATACSRPGTAAPTSSRGG